MGGYQFNEDDNDGFAVVLIADGIVAGVFTGFDSREDAQKYADKRDDIIRIDDHAFVVPMEGV